jgi:hypothetical protein
MIRPASVADLLLAYSRKQVSAFILERGDEICACGGTFQRDGRNWAFLDILSEVTPKEGVRIVRAVRRVVQHLQSEAVIICDEETYAAAPRLLRAVGFEPTEEIINGARVWKCQG